MTFILYSWTWQESHRAHLWLPTHIWQVGHRWTLLQRLWEPKSQWALHIWRLYEWVCMHCFAVWTSPVKALIFILS